MRPQIICQMMSSVDGRIVGNGWTRPYDGTDYETVIACYFDISNDMGADAEWLGRKTVQTDLVRDTFDHGQSRRLKVSIRSSEPVKPQGCVSSWTRKAKSVIPATG